MPFLSPADIRAASRTSDDFFYLTDERFVGRGTARLQKTFLKHIVKPSGNYSRAVVILGIDGFDDPVSLLLNGGSPFDIECSKQLIGAVQKVRWRSLRGSVLAAAIGSMFPETPDGDTPEVNYEDIIVGYEVKAKDKDGKTFYNASFFPVDDEGNEIDVADLPKAE